MSVIGIWDKNNNQTWPDLACFLHIPLIKGELQDLYKVLPNPTIIQRILVEYQAEPFLALSSNQNTASELSNQDLLRCSRYDEVWHCPSYNKMNRNPKNLCGYSLFFNLDAEKTCTTKVSHRQSFAHQIATRRFAIGNLQPFNLGVTCPNGTTYSSQPAGVQIITLPEGCSQINTPDEILYSNPEIAYEADLIQRPLTIPHDLLQKGIPEQINIHDKLVDHFLAAPNLQPIDLNNFKTQMKIQELRYQAAKAFSFFTILGYGVTAIAALLLFLLVCLALFV